MKRLMNIGLIMTLIFSVLLIFGHSIEWNNPIKPMTLSAKTAPDEEKIPVLMYHSISENPADWNSIVISPEKFYEDMLYVKTMGFNTITSQELIAYKNGESDLPDNPIMVTFDDGYRDNYLYAFPTLEKLEMKAIISVIGWSVGRSKTLDEKQDILPHFSWEEAKEMVDSGFVDIQNHTFDLHTPADADGYGKGVLPLKEENTGQHAERFRSDASMMHEEIKKQLGYEPRLFTYPYGAYNETTEKVLKELDYEITLSTEHGIADTKNLFLMKRINTPDGQSGPALMKHITDGEEIPFSNIPNRKKRIEKLEELLGL
ncbi:polysaccharide deacetylase family protein [Halobacillus yeomjeoni]|uniref:Polysaccharide deacetylase family protein n=1 Tax=Halobacillus yeomjeoni TaxID=311194 RepID=A0A931HWW6_9BACI|nr:polysaccharide deacetylase family protein [Halobacillus yeomjeoni]MBH0230860.1 polysaccharide deacetylase family protein [Halobacillus yeomjeoni]